MLKTEQTEVSAHRHTIGWARRSAPADLVSPRPPPADTMSQALAELAERKRVNLTVLSTISSLALGT